MIFTLIINSILVAVAVLIHFEALNLLTKLIPGLSIKPRLRVLIGVFGAIIAHVVEIWVFAFGYYFMIQQGSFGSLVEHSSKTLTDVMDCSYFSFVSYTSLGFGDIVAQGDIRFLSGLEALTGLVLISWTASFMFIEMQKLWRDK